MVFCVNSIQSDSDDDLRHLYASVTLACVSGIGPRLRQLLLERFGSPEAVLAARPEELRSVARIGPKISEEILAANVDSTAEEVIALCCRNSVSICLEGSSDYPSLLARICDPPGILFVRGTIQPCDSLAIAIVGARHATSYGIKVAEQLAGNLARAGYTIISGLARGIDAAAHRGALSAGGRTIAVLGSGVLNIYPPEHEQLANEIAAHGAVISELPPLVHPSPGAFPQRNRIISGMTLGTVVVQASERSGAIITARLASEQGREVFAVPGSIEVSVSRGCHMLLRDGAKLVETANDILEELGPLFETTTSRDGLTIRNPVELQLDDQERRVLEAAGDCAVLVDEIVETSGLAASQVFSTLSVLEMRKLLRRLPGNRVERI